MNIVSSGNRSAPRWVAEKASFKSRPATTMAQTAMGQAKTVKSEMRVETGVVEAIEASRPVTLKKPDGTFVQIFAGPAIDPNTPSVTFTGPNGRTHTSKVRDTAALAKVKVGDKVDIVWTEAVLVPVERGQ